MSQTAPRSGDVRTSIAGPVLVVGGTGRVGGRVAGALLDRGIRTRLLTRSGADAAGLVARGAARVVGDLRDAASLTPAVRGMAAVVVTATGARGGGDNGPAMVDDAGVARLILASEQAGVGRLVLVSAAAANRDSVVELLRAKAAAETYATASGLAWTVVAPDMFMESWVGSVVAGPALAGAPVLLVEGAPDHSLVAEADVASAVLAALEQPWTIGRRLVLGGPERLAWTAVVDAWAASTGRRPLVRTLSAEAAVARGDHLALLLEPVGAGQEEMAATAARLGLVQTSLAAWLRSGASGPA